jgi:Uroporphyrinogen-III methylase
VVWLKGGDPFIFGCGGEEFDVVRVVGLLVFVMLGVMVVIGCAVGVGMLFIHCDHV